MIRVLARGWAPAVAAGVLIAASTSSAAIAALILVAVGLASVRIAGERAWSLLPQGALAASLIDPDRWQMTVAIIALASVAAVAIRPDRSTMAVTNALSSLVAVAAVAVVAASATASIRRGALGGVDGARLIAVAIVWFVADTALWTVREPHIGIVYRDAFVRLLRDARVAIIILSATLAFGALWHHSPLWATLASLLPFALAWRLADQVRRHRVLVDLTVQALGRLPEAAGVAQRGHSKNVTSLAVAMGRVRGLAGRELETLRRAALLHDVGLVAATQPEVDADGFVTADVSAWGADILASNDEFRRETALMREMSAPYRSPGADPTAGDAARLIRVACRAITMLEVDPVDQVVESMYAESVYTFDPQAIALVRPAIRLLGWPALPELN